MPKTIDDAISILDPFKRLIMSTPKTNHEKANSSMQDSIATILVNDQLNPTSNTTVSSSDEYFSIHNEFIASQKTKKNTSSLNHRQEYTRITRLSNLLKNPVAALLHSDLDARNKSNEDLDDTSPPLPLDVIGSELPHCMLCYTPEPSKFFIDAPLKRRPRCIHQTKALKPGQCLDGGTRLPAVRAFCRRATDKFAMIENLKKFGNIENIEQIGDRTYKITYTDLIGACQAIEGHDPSLALVKWFHGRLANQYFKQRKNSKHPELRVQLLSDYF